MIRVAPLLLAGLLLSSSGLTQAIPEGTALPVMVSSTLDVTKDKPGQAIRGRLMQDVTLPSGDRVPSGARLAGHVVEVSQRTAAAPSSSRIVLTFDQLAYAGRVFPIMVHLRAIASMMSVHDAQLPTSTFDDYGTSTSDWTTIQIGGDAVYRGDGSVISPYGERVARANDTGYVWGKLKAVAAYGCHGALDGNDREQSLWIFSPSACGTYGFADLHIARAGHSQPNGLIQLESAGNVVVRGGSAWLLRVDSPSSPPPTSIH